MIGLLAACSGKDTENATISTDGAFEENVFDQVSDSTQAPTQTTNGQQNSEPTQSTTPTQGQQSSGTEQTTEPTIKPTQPAEPDQKPTQNTDPTDESTAPAKPTEPASDLAAEYEAYNAMSNAEKVEFRETFENINEFFKWYNAARKAYKEAHPAIPIPPDGNITLP